MHWILLHKDWWFSGFHLCPKLLKISLNFKNATSYHLNPFVYPQTGNLYRFFVVLGYAHTFLKCNLSSTQNRWVQTNMWDLLKLQEISFMLFQLSQYRLKLNLKFSIIYWEENFYLNQNSRFTKKKMPALTFSSCKYVCNFQFRFNVRL